MYNNLREIMYLRIGGVVEWFKALVLKTSVSARAPWVRIPPPPSIKLKLSKNLKKDLYHYLLSHLQIFNSVI